MKQMHVKQWVGYVYKVYTNKLEAIHKQEIKKEKERRSNGSIYEAR